MPLDRLCGGRPARAAALLLLAFAALSACRRGPASARDFDVVLVTLDTVRADRLGAYGWTSAETPALDRLAREGVRFDSVSAVAPLTLPSHATLLSGWLPPQHGLRNNGGGRFPESAPSLAAHLAAAGYRTGAFVGAFVLDHRFGLDRGFERYDDNIDRDPEAPTGLAAERPGAAVVDRALAWMGETSAKPRFLWVHLFDAHAPYEPPEPFRSRHAGRAYDGEIAYVDAQVGRLLRHLDESGRASRTLVVVVADHGESLGEHGEPTHGLFVYESTLRVPLLMRLPSILAAGARIAAPISAADVAPTVAGLLERPFPPTAQAGVPAGRDLSAALRRGGEPEEADVYAESEYPRTFGWSGLAALRRGTVKLIGAPRPELYDLARDPMEARDVAAGDRRRGPYETRLAEMRRILARAAVVPAARMDAETRERLESLGYAAAPPSAAPVAGAERAGRDPKDVVALFRDFETANAELNAGRLREAAARLEALVGADPANAVFRGHLAQAYRRAGDYRRALPLYQRAAADAPADSDARYNLGVALQEVGRSADALAALGDAARLDPDRPEIHNARGIALLATGREADALGAFDRAAALDPRDARVHNNRGNVLRKMARYDAAEQAYRRAAELAPRYADPLNGLGTLEVERDRPREALPYFDAALARAPEFHEVRLNRGIALEMMGDTAAAIAAYRSFLDAAGADPSLAEQRRIAAQLAARLETRR